MCVRFISSIWFFQNHQGFSLNQPNLSKEYFMAFTELSNDLLQPFVASVIPSSDSKSYPNLGYLVYWVSEQVDHGSYQLVLERGLYVRFTIPFISSLSCQFRVHKKNSKKKNSGFRCIPFCLTHTYLFRVNWLILFIRHFQCGIN